MYIFTKQLNLRDIAWLGMSMKLQQGINSEADVKCHGLAYIRNYFPEAGGAEHEVLRKPATSQNRPISLRASYRTQ